MAEGFACPPLHTPANGQHGPAKAYDAPECRVLETTSLPQRYNVVLEENDDSLQQERLECSIVVQGCMAQHRCATMYGSRDAKSHKQLHVLRPERASTQLQNIPDEPDPRCRADMTDLLVPDDAIPPLANLNKQERSKLTTTPSSRYNTPSNLQTYRDNPPASPTRSPHSRSHTASPSAPDSRTSAQHTPT